MKNTPSDNTNSQIPSFLHSTVELGHLLWKNLVKPGDLAVDATCGNGSDTIFLAELVLKGTQGSVIAIDIQNKAIENTKARLLQELTPITIPQIEFICNCHSQLANILGKRKPKLIVYNLGYLPGYDKSIKTTQETTLQSIQAGLECLDEHGAISITCYPGHAEGAVEEETLINFSKQLDPRKWRTLFCRFTNRTLAPSLILIQKN